MGVITVMLSIWVTHQDLKRGDEGAPGATVPAPYLHTRVSFIMRILFAFSVLLLFGRCATITTPPAGEQTAQRLVSTPADTLAGDYLLYLPEGYSAGRGNWPLMLFLHGAGERGDDLDKVMVHGPPKLIAEGEDFPFIIASPQCPEGQWWSIAFLDALLTDLVNRYRVDEDRIYVTGLSMGGFGTWDLATAYPGRFAAIAPICGGGDVSKACRIRDVPTWVFHGAKDTVVPLERSEEMVEELRTCGGQVEFTIYPDAGHDSWTETYENTELYTWMLRHRR